MNTSLVESTDCTPALFWLLVHFESPWGLLGFIPLVTGILGTCPLYTELDVSTVGGPHRVRHA